LLLKISIHTFSRLFEKRLHTLSSLLIDLAIFKNIKYDFFLFHHFHAIIAAIIFDQLNQFSTALAIL